MQFVFDAIIFFILFFAAYWMYVLIRSFFYDRERQIQTKLIRVCFLIFLFSCFLAVSWGSFIEPRRLTVETVNINLGQTPEREQIKIALLTDFHLGPYKKAFFTKRIADSVMKQNPDVILLGGDYILGGDGASAKYLAPLQELSKRIPTYAVLGNHEFRLGGYHDPRFMDRSGLLRKLFAEWNIKILENKTAVVTARNAKFNLTGLPEIWTDKINYQIAKINFDPLLPAILLVHNPDAALDKEAANFNLILSGHTHAGQIRLPLVGAVPPLPTELGRKFDRGLFKTDSGYLYISAGLGETGARARLFCPPEITIINVDL